MAIKDQCINCKHNTSIDSCAIKGINLVYDGISCADYSRNSIDLTKSESIISDNGIGKDETISRGKVHGWLSFFLVIMGLGGILTPVLGFRSMSLSDYDFDIGLGDGWLVTGAACDGILFLGVAFLAIYTIISFSNYEPNAVTLAKSYLIIGFITNLFGLIGEEQGSMPRLIWGVIWFLYLSSSEQVKTLFPKKERKLFKRDKILLFSIVSPVVIWLLAVFAIAFNQSFQEEILASKFEIKESSLSLNEYTDGRIVFECPNGITAEKQIEEDETFFSLSQDDRISITLYSTYDNTDTQKYFEECMQTLSDESLEDFKYEIKNENHYVSNGNSFYIKTLQYQTEPLIEWSFILIFNKETSKCCLISCFSTEETNHLDELINTIRFK